MLYTWERNKRDHCNNDGHCSNVNDPGLRKPVAVYAPTRAVDNIIHTTYCSTSRVYVNSFNKIDDEIHKNIMNYESTL